MPDTIQADPAALLHNAASLLRTETAFIDQKQLGACRCLLGAAAGGSLTASDEKLSRLEARICAAPPDVAQALVELVHGQEVVINERSIFFSLFELAETEQIGACAEVCEDAVSSGMHKHLPIRLQFSPTQWQTILQVLYRWHESESPFLTDADVICVSCLNLEEPIGERARIHVHAVLMAASCEYLRGLWAGGFSETGATELSLPVIDPADATAIKALVKVIYGGVMEMETNQELIHLCVLADKMQCQAVLTKAIEQLAKVLTPEEAIELLECPSPPPQALYQTAVTVIACNVDSTETIDSMSWTAASRLLEAPREHQTLLREAQRHTLLLLTTERVVKPGFAQLGAQPLGAALASWSSPWRPVTCSGLSSDKIKVVDIEYGGKVMVLVSRLQYDDDEEARITISGPAEIRFNSFSTEKDCDVLCIRGVRYSGRKGPPVLRVERGHELQMLWSTDGSNTYRGWEFVATRLDGKLGFVDKALLVKPILEGLPAREPVLEVA